MTVETPERQTVIHIDMRDTNPVKQRSFTLAEVRTICRLDKTSYRERTQDKEFGNFWKADNRDVKGAHPRFDDEHVDYMVMVVNGLMTEAVAHDLWELRKKAKPDALGDKALAPLLPTRRGKGARK